MIHVSNAMTLTIFNSSAIGVSISKMSIQYTPGIGTASKFGAFGKILLLWAEQKLLSTIRASTFLLLLGLLL